jgi:REP element-mobilizing transposase RayT
MPRSARLDKPGILQHVIIRGIERRQIFRDDDDRDDMLDRLAGLLAKTGTACYAWAFLDNHAHFLFRSGPRGIAALMRRLLTGYVVGFNHHHRRSGQLFQNRYKSIVCQEDAYLKRLVAYIHLNPLRAKLVGDLAALADYPYCGHGVLLGAWSLAWQDAGYVLRQFGPELGTARQVYLEYVIRTAEMGRQSELVGGTVRRSLEGWKKVKPPKESGIERRMVDSRILGQAEFVESVLSEARQRLNRRYTLQQRGWDFERVLERAAAIFNVPTEYMLSRSRKRPRSEARSLACYWAVRELGLSTAELARRFEMTTAGVNYAVDRGQRIAAERGIVLDDG